jgi:hypothetical protein
MIDVSFTYSQRLTQSPLTYLTEQTFYNNPFHLTSIMSQIKEFSAYVMLILVAAIVSTTVLSGFLQQSYAQPSNNNKQLNSTTTNNKEAQNQAFILKQIIASHTNQSNSSQTTSNFETAKEQYLAAWNHTAFHSGFDTFIQPFSATGYGVYVSHPPVFKPGDSMVLYAEPVGYGFEQVVDAQGNALNQINLTAVITIASSNGTQLASPLTAPLTLITSHNKNTEMYLTLKVDQSTPFPVGDYKITYNIMDGSTGKSFQLVKTVKVANFVSAG